MPIYEYRCTDGHSFDVMQSMSDDPVAVCEVCGKPVQRVLHSPAVHFKGSGFYNTDYGTKKRGPSGKEGESTASSDSNSSSKESSSDSKSSGSSGSGDSKTKAATKSGD